MPSAALHISTIIARSYDEVYDYVADPRNMAAWASGLANGLEETSEEGVWTGEGPTGRIRVRFAERNRHGVVDHDVTLPDGTVVHVPLRVLRCGDGAEVVLTLFRRPKMTDVELETDRENIERDLAELKRVLESKHGETRRHLEHLRFPNESEAYRDARNDLLEDEMELRRFMERVAAKRRRLPPGGLVPRDYVFERMGSDGKPERVKMSELFSPKKDTLVVYSFMFGPERERPCPGCTHFLDGLDGATRHFTQRLDFVVVAKSPIARIDAFAKERGWRFLRLLSTAGNEYDRDYFGDSQGLSRAVRKQQDFKDGEEWDMPILNVFQRGPEGIRHTWAQELLYVPPEPGQEYRHDDLLDPVWTMLDVTPEGRGDFHPALKYA
jgi:predicted dithiol-disulfide oxidoreductase (DUF899 family)